MKALILDGSQNGDRIAEQACAALTAELAARQTEVERIRIVDKTIAPCMGDFFCWIKTPGVCNLDDDNREIACAIVHADLIIYLTPITFGGYSSELKRPMDHIVQTVSPFFEMVDGEVHHRRRYKHYPRLLAIGWQPEADPVSEAIFHHLVYRNGLNMQAANMVSGVLHDSDTAEQIGHAVSGWLSSVMLPRAKKGPELPQPTVQSGEFAPPRRALLLIGSPRGKTSSSQSLGGYLFERLAERGIQTETIRLQTVLRSPERQMALLRAAAEADLIVLAAPLYVDSLPAQTIRMLEMLVDGPAHRDASHPQRFAAIINCGFPESNHNQTALAICSQFAREAGYSWAGGLSLGAGQGIVHGAPLAESGNQTRSIRRSLDIAAEALAAGLAIPPESVTIMAKPVIPAWLYLLMGGIGWRQQARKYGVQKQLDARPYA